METIRNRSILLLALAFAGVAVTPVVARAQPFSGQATQPVTAAAASKSEALPPGGRVLVVQSGTGPSRLIRALKVENYKEIVFVTEESSKREGMPAANVRGQAALPEGEPSSWSASGIAKSEAELDALAAKFPALQAQIAPVTESLKKIAKANQEAAAAALAKEVSSLLSKNYDPSLSSEEIKKLVDAANALAAKAPGSSQQIAAWVQPWKDHLAKLQSGQVWANGSWKATEDPAPRPAAEVPAVPAAQPAASSPAERVLHLSATVVPGTTMAVAIAGIAVYAFLVLMKVLSDIRRFLPAGNGVILSSKSARMAASLKRKPPGILHLLVTLSLFLFLSGGVYVVWKLATERQTIDAFRAKYSLSNAPESDLLKSLLAGANTREEGERVRLPVKDADAFMKKGIVWDSEEMPMKEFSLVRTGLAAAQTPPGVVLAEELHFFGSPIVVEYLIPKATGGNGTVKMDITANGLPVPGRLASFFWTSLVDRISEAYKKSEFAKEYRVVSFQGDTLVFESLTAKPANGG